MEQDPANSTIKLTDAPTFDFGTVKIGATTLNLDASQNGGSVKGNLTVANPGIATGWKVTVKGSAFEGVGDTTNPLKGAVLSLTGGTATATEENNASAAPVTPDVLDVNDQDALVFNAPAGAGIGTWQNVFAPENVKLVIPQGNTAGSYQSQLTWTLSDTPA